MGISLESPFLTKPLWVGFCYMGCNAASWHSCPLSFLPHHGKLPPYKMAFTRLGGPSVTSIPSTYMNHLCVFRVFVLQCLLYLSARLHGRLTMPTIKVRKWFSVHGSSSLTGCCNGFLGCHDSQPQVGCL